jgi:hypothetical protein
MEQVNDKVFFVPGDVCTLRQDLPNKPIMLVVRKKTISVKGEE